MAGQNTDLDKIGPDARADPSLILSATPSNHAIETPKNRFAHGKSARRDNPFGRVPNIRKSSRPTNFGQLGRESFTEKLYQKAFSSVVSEKDARGCPHPDPQLNSELGISARLCHI